MSYRDLIGMWPAIASALGNHLWQSTVFAIAAGLFTLLLRKNRARARYWIWLAASLKFLITFSLLVDFGRRLAWLRGSTGTKATLYFALEQISHPFTQRASAATAQTVPATVFSSLTQWLPALAAVWVCGFLVIVLVWFVRWRRISAVIRSAEPLREGREVETLRRLESTGGKRQRIAMLSSGTSLEPGIFGIVRPVLVWPRGISDRLDDEHLEAILNHELLHVRHYDNLAAAMHMMVEAIFWFHPLVWWLGARLMEERERGCDEQVLESGSKRQVYAESILKICEFCLHSPLDCVSAVTGADLKKRIARIMSEHRGKRMDIGKKLLLATLTVTTLAVPFVFGLLSTPQTHATSRAQDAGDDAFAYESVSIKLDEARRRL